jgi:hypothetical protein
MAKEIETKIYEAMGMGAGGEAVVAEIPAPAEEAEAPEEQAA